jgi:hypothetical protein
VVSTPRHEDELRAGGEYCTKYLIICPRYLLTFFQKMFVAREVEKEEGVTVRLR